MKILTIESPQRLKDRTVKASITVAEENYIPLIVMSDDAYKGKEIELDVKKPDSEPEHDSIWEFAQRQARELDTMLRQARESGIQEGIERAKFNVAPDDFPATLVERFDKQIEGNKPATGNLENSCGTNK